MGGLEFQHGAPSGPEQRSGHELAVAGFHGSMPVHDAGGLRQQQAKSPVFLPTRWVGSPSMNGGKGFGGGEATRDPEATWVDPNDPKGKQQAIHKAESFADYLAKRTGAPAAAPAAEASAASNEAEGGKGFGGGEATRDPAPTVIDPNDPKGKQQAIHKAESFADYLARRGA